MDKIIIKDLTVEAILGIYKQERLTPQKVVLNVEVFTDIRAAAHSDSIADCVDYEQLANRLRAHVKTAKRQTVEASPKIWRNCVCKRPGRGLSQSAWKSPKPTGMQARSVSKFIEKKLSDKRTSRRFPSGRLFQQRCKRRYFLRAALQSTRSKSNTVSTESVTIAGKIQLGWAEVGETAGRETVGSCPGTAVAERLVLVTPMRVSVASTC